MKHILFTLSLVFCFRLFADIKSDVQFLASDSMNGRVSGSQANADVQNWLMGRLQLLNVRPAGNTSKNDYRNSFVNSYDFKTNQKISGTNIIGIVYPSGKWTDQLPTVMIGAHFDHTDKCWQKFGNTDQICNGATDNATAVAAVLSILPKLTEQIKTPVIIAFWDAEEQGLLGSDAYLKSPTIDLKNLVAYINLDIIGLNLFSGLENHHMIIGSETGGPILQKLVQEYASQESNIVKYHQPSYAFGHGRSDMTSFIRHGLNVPILFFSDGDGAVYHSNSDHADYVNFEKVASIAKVIQNLTMALSAMKATDITYQAPTVYLDKGTWLNKLLQFVFGAKNQFKTGLPIPSFSDVAIVIHLYETLLENKDRNKLPAETVMAINDTIKHLKIIQDNGQRQFTIKQKFDLLKSAAYFTLYSKQLTFIP
jgi:hypothetical protein